MINVWTDERIEHAKAVLATCPQTNIGPVIERLSRDFGFVVTKDSLTNALRRRGMGTPSLYCQGGPSQVQPSQPPVRSVPQAPAVQPSAPRPSTPSAGAGPDPELARLFQAAKKGVPFADLCDALDLSPKAVRSLLDRAKATGMALDVDVSGTVGYRQPQPGTAPHPIVAPTVGGQRIVAVISDTHLGSKYCKRAELREFIHYAYDQGARILLHCGDVLDGQYENHGRYELSHHGIDEQTRDLFETLPQLPGMTLHGTLGNHDECFTKLIGVDVGQYIQNYFQARGRDDVRFYEARGTYLEIYGAIFELWHPGKNLAYSKSYHLQKRQESYDSVNKPHVLLAGHWHTFCHVVSRNIHAIACPTFQGGGSSFGRMLGGQPAMGGLILRWESTEAGVLRNFQVEYRSYHERENPHHVPTHAVG